MKKKVMDVAVCEYIPASAMIMFAQNTFILKRFRELTDKTVVAINAPTYIDINGNAHTYNKQELTTRFPSKRFSSFYIDSATCEGNIKTNYTVFDDVFNEIIKLSDNANEIYLYKLIFHDETFNPDTLETEFCVQFSGDFK